MIGNGCPNCARLIPQEEIIKTFKNVHEDKYDYSLVEYKGDKEKVKIICKMERTKFVRKWKYRNF